MVARGQSVVDRSRPRTSKGSRWSTDVGSPWSPMGRPWAPVGPISAEIFFFFLPHPFFAVVGHGNMDYLGTVLWSLLMSGHLGLLSRFVNIETVLRSLLFKSSGEVFGHFPPIPSRRGTWFPTSKSGRWLKDVARARLYGAGHLGHSSQWPSHHVLKVLATTCREGYLGRRETAYIEFVRSCAHAMGLLGTLPGGGTLVPVQRLGSARPPNT